MYKQMPNRNQRLKGFKGIDGLKTALLLAVCVWLLYQLKHNYDKRNTFDEDKSKLSEKTEESQAVLMFGRKGLRSRVKESVLKNKEQIDEEEERNKNAREDKKKEEVKESKNEEDEDEARDDELDEQDRDEAEEIADMEQSLEEEEFEVAREEQYNGDNASSAVPRDTQVLNTDTENGTKEMHEMELVDGSRLGLLNQTSSDQDVVLDQNASGLRAGDDEMVEGNLTDNARKSVEKAFEITLSQSENGSQPNSSTKPEPDDQSEVNNNSASQNAGISFSSIQNGTVSPQKTMSFNSTAETLESDTSESANESDVQYAEDKGIKSDNSANAVETSVSFLTKENGNSSKEDEGKIEAGTEEAGENASFSTTNENLDPVDTDVNEAQKDLGLLPETVTEGNNSQVAVDK